MHVLRLVKIFSFTKPSIFLFLFHFTITLCSVLLCHTRTAIKYFEDCGGIMMICEKVLVGVLK